MNIGNKIKEYRTISNLSQEELASKVFVSRQTISNWENNKYYPDIKSISLLSNIFNISIEDFISEDLEKIKTVIEKTDIKKFNILSWVYTIELLIMIISAYPLTKYLRVLGVIFWIIFTLITMITALTIEKFKKTYDIKTYKEIVSFCENKNKSLSYAEKKEEIVKRPYQRILRLLLSGITGITVFILMELLLG